MSRLSSYKRRALAEERDYADWRVKMEMIADEFFCISSSRGASFELMNHYLPNFEPVLP